MGQRTSVEFRPTVDEFAIDITIEEIGDGLSRVSIHSESEGVMWTRAKYVIKTTSLERQIANFADDWLGAKPQAFLQ